MAEPAQGLELTKWFIPMLWAMFGFYFQSVCLHYATYVYIHKYADAPSNFARLADPFQEDLFKKENLNIHILDLLAGFFPGMFFLLSAFLAFGKVNVNKRGKLQMTSSGTLADGDRTPSFQVDTGRSDTMRKNVLQLWTKVMLCAGFLFILKGTLGAVTVVPDSSGWDVCKARLKALGFKWMKEEHSFSDMVWIDFHWLIQYGQPLRYCGDMMYSGHTFVVTLFGLGLYELIRIIRPTRGRFSKHANLCKMFILIGLTIFSVGEQLLEIYSVEKSRFHYSSDIIVALVVTFLLYTNGVVAIVSKKWSKDGLGTLKEVWKDMKMVCAPCQAIAKGAEQDKWHKADEPPEEPRQDSSEQSKRDFQVAKEHWERSQAGLEDGIRANKDQWEHLISNGDIFIPPCCVPCCCYAGREHIYSDSQLKELMDTFVLKDTTHDEQLRAPLQEYLKEHMVFSEGVSWHNFMSALAGHKKEDSRRTPLMAGQTHP